MCAPKICSDDSECPAIGDVCNEGSISGLCQNGECVYDEIRAIAGCVTPPTPQVPGNTTADRSPFERSLNKFLYSFHK